MPMKCPDEMVGESGWDWCLRLFPDYGKLWYHLHACHPLLFLKQWSKSQVYHTLTGSIVACGWSLFVPYTFDFWFHPTSTKQNAGWYYRPAGWHSPLRRNLIPALKEILIRPGVTGQWQCTFVWSTLKQQAKSGGISGRCSDHRWLDTSCLPPTGIFKPAWTLSRSSQSKLPTNFIRCLKEITVSISRGAPRVVCWYCLWNQRSPTLLSIGTPFNLTLWKRELQTTTDTNVSVTLHRSCFHFGVHLQYFMKEVGGGGRRYCH